jgi:UDP-N-acetylmuramoyl-tripeptide--D-alanyl-D-alanine ligase
VTAIALTASWVAAAMRGTIVSGDPAREFSGVAIDTRTLQPGELFVGVRGERFDGAAFAGAAVAAGAAGVVVPIGGSRDLKETAATAIEVEDTTAALQALARVIRRESGTRVVAITGSAGKTTTKEVTAEFLSTKYAVVRNRGNFNNHIGLPLSLVDLRRRPDVAVVELGMNHEGEIRTLVSIAEPDVRVWTNVGEAHVGFFPSVDAIADAKAEILERATADTVLVANADDDRIAPRIASFAGRIVTFGIEREADVRATAVVDRGVDGTSAHVTTRQGAADIVTPLVGRGNLANILAATAVALVFDIPLGTIAEKAAALHAAAHRGEVIRLRSGVIVVDDSYNANPTATRLALSLLATTTATRRIAVLGEMLELGDRAEELHAGVGRAAAERQVDALVAIGGRAADAMANAAIAAGLPRASVQYFSASDDAAEAVAAMVRPGDVVLVKGSRGIKTDRVVSRLSAEQG